MSAPLVCLVVLDGWGLAPPGPGNAVELADTPTFDRLWADYPHTQLDASGRAVGLPDGQMGNSEVGHTNLGAGRVVRQDLVRIDDDIASGAFFQNGPLVDACRKARGSALHLLGLVSDGGVHSHLRHLRALIELARRGGRRARARARLHRRARHLAARRVQRYLDGHPRRSRRSAGRYYAMDRDRRWDRAKRAYDAIVHGVGARAEDAVEAVRASYAAGVTDEFIEPVVIGDPVARAGSGRATRPSSSTSGPTAPASSRGPSPSGSSTASTAGPTRRFPHYVQMTEYADDVVAPVAFPGEDLAGVLAQVLASPRRRSAARRRDREVRPRHLLLRRRLRDALLGRGVGAGRLAARRRRPTTRSRA